MSGGGPIPVPTDEKILCIEDLKIAADKKLPRMISEFYNAGSTDQRTITDNSAALAKFRLRSRVLINVKDSDITTTCLDRKISFPLCISPAGLAGMAHKEGEIGITRAAAKWNINHGISSFATYPIDEIVGAAREIAPISHAIQLYSMRDRARQEMIIRDAEKAGVKAILLTGDSPVLGVRYNEWRNDFRTPAGISWPVLGVSSAQIRQATHDNSFAAFNDDEHSWERDIPWLRARTKMKIFVKGVLCREDVEAAVKAGVDGVIVSNHGGRQLDGVPATIDVLEECVDAAQGKIEVHIDGGFRRGTEIFVALALGAKCVWVGRPALWAVAYDGQKGVERMIEILYEDFRRCMALCGCKTIQDINRTCLSRMGSDGVLRPLQRRYQAAL